MPKITNEKKLEAIKDFLKGENIQYGENYASKCCGLTIPLVIVNHRVAIQIGDDQDFFVKTRGKYYPIFIRDEDTKAKVIEKVQNTIIKSMIARQKKLAKSK